MVVHRDRVHEHGEEDHLHLRHDGSLYDADHWNAVVEDRFGFSGRVKQIGATSLRVVR